MSKDIKYNSNRQIYMVEVVDEEIVINGAEEGSLQEILEGTYELMIISLQAFTGVTCYRTIRVIVYHEKRPLQVLIDIGSTCNFIDQDIAKKFG